MKRSRSKFQAVKWTKAKGNFGRFGTKTLNSFFYNSRSGWKHEIVELPNCNLRS
ncbi:hypothetical protein D917_08293 [Trichinella nativa]|uniref:Uncharacterized protein n=1 Tax=Trichinella nativa TaxID=6335 RepID=A0A1Y3EKH1_9BILA|nr:hypothetical protein D917_08293 [Trichinella nativa]